jgi:hypothetical protein
MTHHNQIKELTTWFISLSPILMHAEVYLWFVVRPHKPFHVRFGSFSANLQSTYEIF